MHLISERLINVSSFNETRVWCLWRFHHDWSIFKSNTGKQAVSYWSMGHQELQVVYPHCCLFSAAWQSVQSLQWDLQDCKYVRDGNYFWSEMTHWWQRDQCDAFLLRLCNQSVLMRLRQELFVQGRERSCEQEDVLLHSNREWRGQTTGVSRGQCGSAGCQNTYSNMQHISQYSPLSSFTCAYRKTFKLETVAKP